MAKPGKASFLNGEERIFMVYRNGLPYEPDVAKLQEAFPPAKLTEGLVISHEDLETIIVQKRPTQRYYGVVNAWIRHCRDKYGIVIVWSQGKGVEVLEPSGVQNLAEKKTSQKIRQVGRAVKLFGLVDRNRLDEPGQRRLDHYNQVTQRLTAAISTARKEFAVEIGPTHSLPKRQIPQGESK